MLTIQCNKHTLQTRAAVCTYYLYRWPNLCCCRSSCLQHPNDSLLNFFESAASKFFSDCSRLMRQIKMKTFSIFFVCCVYIYIHVYMYIWYTAFFSWAQLLTQMHIHLVTRRLWVQCFGLALFPLFCWDWSWNLFYGHSLPFADSRMAVVSYWQRNGHWVLVNCLVGLSLSRKNGIRLTDSPDMTIDVQKHHNKTTLDFLIQSTLFIQTFDRMTKSL